MTREELVSTIGESKVIELEQLQAQQTTRSFEGRIEFSADLEVEEGLTTVFYYQTRQDVNDFDLDNLEWTPDHYELDENY